MLKNIRLHIEKDEEKQKDLDQTLAATIVEMQHTNINSFARNIPSLVPTIKSTSLQNHSLFCNKFGEINVVDYGVGRTLYGFHPLQEITQQVQRFEQHSPVISLAENATTSTVTDEPSKGSLDFHTLNAFQVRQQQPSLPEEIECLVVLGCGLGMHLPLLLSQHKIKNLVIYEPQIQYFQCSSLAIDWSEIFALGKKNGTAIFLQIEKDGRNIVDDIQQLQEHEGISKFRIFKHYNHPIFDAIFNELSQRSWSDIKKNGFKVSETENYLTYVPSWTPEVNLQQCAPVSEKQQRFEKNLKAFEKYYPEIYKKFKTYKPVHWLPIKSQEDEVNLLNKENLTTWYGESPIHDCQLNFDNFYSQPNKDGLVLGYSGKKLAHYEHYKFVKKTEELLKQAEDEIGELPSTVASIIMFGLGVGYQLEHLLTNHKVEKLFICEPNSDFFYASLFAIDWSAIFEKIEKTNARIYLNIGDDGSHLFRDLLSQFHSIGPYILNNTYFYQSYYNSALNSAIGQLREQLQVVISMGEYFDHAYYGIAHTKEGMRRKIPVLTNNPSAKLSYDDKEVPIFIVGNGPSLDSSIEAIKEWQDKAIVVSCGTALQALHRNGITPDFHAEIEQNRSTFDWAVVIGDLDYLKKITLISCNGIHPDTCNLYKDVLVAFKEGESSTVSALNVLGWENFGVLQNAFPTVSNFACDLFSQIGFSTIYLLGVDLGFVNVKHHHSKSSGYYKKDGQETYDYSERNNTSLVVPGNFRPSVNTKHEFKVSRQIIEQVTNAKPKHQIFYNCSDGAKIQGTIPVETDNLLIVSSIEQKQQLIKSLKEGVFSTNGLETFVQKFEKQYSHSLLIKELSDLETLVEQDISTPEKVNQLINKQKELLFRSYKNGKSLLFYYLYGTVNYANAVLTKLSCSSNLQSSPSASLVSAKDCWHSTLNSIKIKVDDFQIEDFDISISFFNKWQKENVYLEQQNRQSFLLVVSSDQNFNKSLKWILNKNFSYLTNYLIIESTDKFAANSDKLPDYVIYYQNIQGPIIRGTKSTIIVSDNINLRYENVTVLPLLIKDKSIIHDTFYAANATIRACLSAHNCDFILGKHRTYNEKIFNDDKILFIEEDYVAYDFPLFVCVFLKNKPSKIKPLSLTGTRGTKLTNLVTKRDLLHEVAPKEDIEKNQKRGVSILNDEHYEQ
ncbi:MAG: 6-hydroxymethylpterin diphosphokinase MptE-like protein [Aliiglaciecola sp.]|uniref:6-hydroxymethylpterin diphosphokinase MptE-like protein n=1 Tax=Aliiglaciecola sp. TaxID=1872441 RepID=UPI0032994FDA